MQRDSLNIFVGETGTIKGRGVFAARAHLEGETVEVCPVVLFSASFAEVPEEVRKILFNWGALSRTNTDEHCLALGYGSIYNHANPANMRYEGDAVAKVLRFVAIRPIAVGEELTVNYSSEGGGHQSPDNDWFTRMGVTRYVDW
ncbi:MAG: SET domain-containing protein-lysine N-methyltransferase [Caldimonas sp.]